MIIYKATNTINNKVYIGQTVNTLEYRANQHLRETRSGKRKNTYFHNAIDKYGFEFFVFEEIDNAESIEELNEKESYWIRYYNSTNKAVGYNLDSGGTNCLKSDETKKKIGDTTREKWKDPVMSKQMIDGLRRGTEVWSKKAEEMKVSWICPICGKELMLAKWEAKEKKVCSSKCAGMQEDNIEHLRRLSEYKHKRNVERKIELAKEILEWCRDNKQVIEHCPYNKITSTLRPMLDRFRIKDIRNIFICFDVRNRRELLSYLKQSIIEENIC